VRRALVLLLLAFAPAPVMAQASQFGVRGLGMPGRPVSARAAGAGGAFAIFDPQSSLNPAAIGGLAALTAGFDALQDFRHVENPAGSASLRDTRFPHLDVAGPIGKRPGVVGLSFSNYTARDFTLASSDTLTIRDTPVPVSDTLQSRGGLSDLRAAGAYRLGNDWVLGGAFHVITGSTRLSSRRTFADSSYRPARQRSELSYAGIGFSLGMVRHFGEALSVAVTIRSDGNVKVDRDSARVARIDLPYTFGLGVRWRPQPKLDLAGQAVMRTWSGANSDLIAQGGLGADNTLEVAVGGEYTPDLRRPGRRPLRFGLRYGTLPFPVTVGQQPHELGVSLGSGLRFAQDRAGIDLGLEHVWRSAGEFSERSFLVNIGVTVRP
jgi:hypothetical protein